MNYNEELRKRIAKLIKDSDSNLKSWGEAAGLSDSLLRHFMRGGPEKSIRYDSLCKIAASQGMTLAELLDIQQEPIDSPLLTEILSRLMQRWEPGMDLRVIVDVAIGVYEELQRRDATAQEAEIVELATDVAARRIGDPA